MIQGLPFGVKRITMEDGLENYMNGFGIFEEERFIFDPEVYVEGMAYTRFFGDEPEECDVLIRRYSKNKLYLIAIRNKTVIPIEFNLSTVILYDTLPNPNCVYPKGREVLLPSIVRIKGGK